MKNVEAYTASWIEIYQEKSYGYVWTVEAYTASWIEIIQSCIRFIIGSRSKPIRLRGLK